MAETTRPSIIVILLDALRADCAPFMPETPHLRSLGLMRPELGALTDLVRGAFLFTQAMACSAYTTACVGSIFTGLLPPEHGVRAFDLTSLSNDVRTLAEILAESGYATCAMTDQPAVLRIVSEGDTVELKARTRELDLPGDTAIGGRHYRP